MRYALSTQKQIHPSEFAITYPSLLTAAAIGFQQVNAWSFSAACYIICAALGEPYRIYDDVAVDYYSEHFLKNDETSFVSMKQEENYFVLSVQHTVTGDIMNLYIHTVDDEGVSQ